MEKDLISIIIPVYNVEKYLKECVDSVRKQTYKNLEIILIDDGSKDNSGKLCDELAKEDNRIKVVHKENGGLSDARNVGIENATRFAFVVEGSTQSTDLNTIQNLKTNSNNNVYIWEPNYDSHTESGILNAKNVYNLDITNNYQELPYEGIKSEIPKNLKVAIDKANKANYPNYFDTVKVSYYTKTNFTNNVEMFSINQGITKLRIYMWLEGQDVDCENDASIGSISLNLQFSTNPN